MKGSIKDQFYNSITMIDKIILIDIAHTIR